MLGGIECHSPSLFSLRSLPFSPLFLQSSARQRRVPALEASSTGMMAGGSGSRENKQGRSGGNQGRPGGCSNSQGSGAGLAARSLRLTGDAAVGTRGGCCGDGSQAGAAARIRKGGGGNQVVGPCPLRFGLLPHSIWPPFSNFAR
jgi:hypothetical protein